MKIPWRSIGQKVLLPVTMGLTDGILTALTLAASSLTANQSRVTVSIALRVAGAAFFSGAFVYFVTKYAEFRLELVRAERELSLLSHGKLALGHLGRSALRDGGFTSMVSSSAAFLGALCPLLVATVLPQHPWASVVAALLALALLGIALAKALYGSVLRWVFALVIGGALLTAIGIRLNVV